MADLRCLCGEEVAAYHAECLALVVPCRRCGSVTPGLQDCYCARTFGERPSSVGGCSIKTLPAGRAGEHRG